MKKTDKTEWVLVETIHSFRMRYMVEVPKGKSEHAIAKVAADEVKEFSQEFIGEQILSHRIVTEKEALELCDIDNSYVKSWTDEQKIDSFFTKMEKK